MLNYCAICELHRMSKTLFGVPKEDEIKKLQEDDLSIKLKKNNLEVCLKF